MKQLQPFYHRLVQIFASLSDILHFLKLVILVTQFPVYNATSHNRQPGVIIMAGSFCDFHQVSRYVSYRDSSIAIRIVS